jgi:hypothetical protein
MVEQLADLALREAEADRVAADAELHGAVVARARAARNAGEDTRRASRPRERSACAVRGRPAVSPASEIGEHGRT